MTKKELEAELRKYRNALQEIRNHQGRVCENFELCCHAACLSSYSSWAVADQALNSSNWCPECGVTIDREQKLCLICASMHPDSE